MGDLTANFSRKEFECRCYQEDCDAPEISIELVRRAQIIRDRMGPMDVTSGVRCKRHNDLIGGASDSTHLTGLAADFEIGTPESHFRDMFVTYTQNVFVRRGLYQHHIHLDIDMEKQQEVLWVGE